MLAQRFRDWVPQHGFGASTAPSKYPLEMFSRKMSFIMKTRIYTAGYVKAGFGDQKVVSLSLKINLEAWLSCRGTHRAGITPGNRSLAFFLLKKSKHDFLFKKKSESLSFCYPLCWEGSGGFAQPLLWTGRNGPSGYLL